MASKTGISYLDATWNPVVGCTSVSEGCVNCWARELHERRHKWFDDWMPGSEANASARPPAQYARPFSTLQCLDDRLDAPLHMRKPRRVGVCFTGDLFHQDVPDEFIDRVFGAMVLATQHTFFVLTKRPERMRVYLSSRTQPRARAHLLSQMLIDTAAKLMLPNDVRQLSWDFPGWPLLNVWLGTTVENQARYDERRESLGVLAAYGWHTWWSFEPLLSAIDMGIRRSKPGVPADWVVVGGESGPNVRPCDVAWIRSIVEQTKAAGLPCYVKQLGARVTDSGCRIALDDRRWPRRLRYDAQGRYILLRHRAGADPAEWPEDLRVRQLPEVRA